MESKKKKPTVDYAAIIREYEMYGRGRSLKKFCDDSGYVYPNVLRYYRKCFWNSKAKVSITSGEDSPFVPLKVENDSSESESSVSEEPSGKTPKYCMNTILESLRNRLIGMSVGRVTLWNYQKYENVHCWLAAFPLLDKNKWKV